MRTQFDGIGLNDSGSTYKRRVATISPDYRESGHTLARAINACHGLDIPEGVSPGALAELVTRLRKVLSYGVTCTSGLDDEQFFPALDSLLDALEQFKID